MKKMYVRSKELIANHYELAKEIANWKKEIIKRMG